MPEEKKQEEDEDIEEELEKGVEAAEITEEMQKAYIDYAMSVIVQRAIPAAEDGLKPVQRRILYSMERLGLAYEKQTVKSARIVGDVIGKYHPHGDMAVYDAMVRMAQDFSLRYPLVKGQGNFGSIDNDPPAAYRYCVAGDSLIITENGLEKADEISDKESIDIKILSKDKTINNASKWFDSGEHETLKITTNKGYSLTGTKNHPILILAKDDFGKPVFEWKLLENIKEGDIAVIDRREDNFWPEKEADLQKFHPVIKNGHQHKRILPSTLNEDLSFIVGALVSEGFVSKNKIEFCNSDKEFIKIFKEKWNNLFPDSKLHEFEKSPSSYGKRNYTRLECHSRYTIEFLRNIGLMPVRSDKKEIPDLILKSPKRVVIKFISAYFEGDGGLGHSRKMFEIRACSTSKRLLSILQILLLRFGIDSFIRFDKHKKLYLNLIRGKRNFLRFYKEINFVGEKKRKKLELIILLYKKEYSSTDYVPFISDFIRKIAGYAENEFAMKHNFDRYSNMQKNYQKVCSILLRKSGIDYSSIFEYLLTYNYLFEPVIKIENTEIQRVYSLKVDSNCHSFISNGFISHNTEAKLEKISEEMLQDLEKNTVNWRPNFDNSVKEPDLLPAKLPNLLLNGASGIAVGMTTNLPPHNLVNVADCIAAYINNPKIEIDKLIEIIEGPDFPTGGYIAGGAIPDLYKNGRGSLVVRGKLTTEENKSKESIVITEIPYQINKTTLIESIAKLVGEKKLPDISDIRDESAKGKIRIVIELRRGADSKFTINRLYQYTNLQTKFDAILLALVKGEPKILNLKQIVEVYVDYRKEIIRKRTKFDLEKAEERKHIVEGLMIALKQLDSVIETIKKSKNTSEALETLSNKYKLSGKQAQAILDMRLAALTVLEQDKLKEENKKLEETIKELKGILESETEILAIIKKELSDLKRQYGENRRTTILQRVAEIQEKDLIQKKEVIVTLTGKGYVKRMGEKGYHEQRRGGKGVIGADLATGDFVKQLITCNTHDYLLFFTNRGRVYWIKAYEIPESERYGKGKAIVNMLNLKDETISSIIPVSKFENFIFMVTKLGQVKKLPLQALSNPRKTGVRAINLPLDNSDILIDVQRLNEKQDVLIVTSEGQAIRFSAEEVRPMGRASYGVTGIKLDKGDYVVSLEVLPDVEQEKKETSVLAITEKGYGKRSEIEEYRKTGRACKGVINLKVNEKTGRVKNTISVKEKDSIIVATTKGMVIRVPVKDIRIMGRATQGVRIIKLQESDSVSDLVKATALEE